MGLGRAVNYGAFEHMERASMVFGSGPIQDFCTDALQLFRHSFPRVRILPISHFESI